ncbi:MAG: hypothetical protein LBV50_01855 [Novosphingobium sp.]|jgi:hypothetical protein|nr:hypothetical protein [Novosphingobium sp.]
MTFTADIAAAGYPAVREAFNDVLALCVGRLTATEQALAKEILDIGLLDKDTPGIEAMFADTALFSDKGARNSRSGRRRAIDRIAPKLPLKRDPLKSEIAARLPHAFFSVFTVVGLHEEGGVWMHDLLDKGRPLWLMDRSLAVQAAGQDEFLIAGRFLDLGPWHVGFGIVHPLRKSEALAISLACTGDEDLAARRGDLHELVYSTELHGDNLVMAALEPIITSIAFAIDTDMLDADDLTAGLGSLLDIAPAGHA